MKVSKLIVDNDLNNIIIVSASDTLVFAYNTLSASEKAKYDAFVTMCSEKTPMIPIPVETPNPVFVIPSPCPKDSNLTPKVYSKSYNKGDTYFNMTILVAHFDRNDNRVPRYDTITTIIADMSEERMVDVTPEGYVAVKDSQGVVRLETVGYQLKQGESFTKIMEYSYVLANTMINNGMSIPELIGKSAQIWYADGSWLKIYE